MEPPEALDCCGSLSAALSGRAVRVGWYSVRKQMRARRAGNEEPQQAALGGFA